MEKESILIKYQMEFTVNASTKLLYNFLSNPSSLSEWFCDDVNTKNNIYTFLWDGSEQKAELLSEKPGKCIRFKWLEMPSESYFEFKLEVDDLTKDVALIVTDFASEEDMESAKQLWTSQIDALRHLIGS